MNEETVMLLTDILEELRTQNRQTQLWDSKDVARFFRVAPATARNRLLCKPEFPKPIQVNGLGRRWFPAEVKAYAERAQR